MKIGELARRAGVEVQTVRYYERGGLLEAPSRTASGYRTYGEHDLERLNFVRHCRTLDMPLAEIRRLLDLSRQAQVPCEDVDRLVSAHLDRVRAKLAALQSLESQLASLRAQCASGKRVADCGILAELIHAAQGVACVRHTGS
ncbi:MAG TPA: Cd(II)/Pb(II)-responsive transcriptional regulator [Burkholderiales bacterium]|jgi:Cd(II)/Pb(II)-responsive transcriptional regulator|nr:Cd(II)/Pb(II)-responsive transcriptional regulator [Burkholderiales bacterium]